MDLPSRSTLRRLNYVEHHLSIRGQLSLTADSRRVFDEDFFEIGSEVAQNNLEVPALGGAVRDGLCRGFAQRPCSFSALLPESLFAAIR
jgi:hypothetical protein